MMLRIALLIAAITIPSAALADENPLKELTPDAVYARGGVLNLSADGASFLKLDIAIGTEVTIVPEVLTGRIEVIFGPGNASFVQGVGDGLKADTEWRSDAFVSMLGSGRLAVFRRAWFDAGIMLSYEATLAGGDMHAVRFAFSDDSGTYDITSFAKDHAALNAGYSRLTALVDLRFEIFDIWTAYVSGGLVKLDFNLDLTLDKAAKEMIESIGKDPSAVAQHYEESYTIPLIQVGSDVDIPNVPIYLSADVQLVPVSIEQLFLGANLSIGLRL